MLDHRPNGAWERFLSGIFSFLLALLAGFQVAATFHHHADLGPHEDCPVCVAAHQGSLAPPASKTVDPVLAEFPASPLSPEHLRAPSHLSPERRSRGPPLLA